MILLQTPADPASFGWLPLLVIIVFVIACVVLFRSFRTQVRKIDFPPEGVPTRREQTDRSHRAGGKNDGTGPRSQGPAG